jgi:hypothetical protein
MKNVTTSNSDTNPKQPKTNDDRIAQRQVHKLRWCGATKQLTALTRSHAPKQTEPETLQRNTHIYIYVYRLTLYRLRCEGDICKVADVNPNASDKLPNQRKEPTLALRCSNRLRSSIRKDVYIFQCGAESFPQISKYRDRANVTERSFSKCDASTIEELQSHEGRGRFKSIRCI